MERTGMLVVALILFAGVLPAVAAACPLNITGELDAYPAMYERCSIHKYHCCEGIADLIKILQYSWMHNNRSFLLPDNRTAKSCVDEFSEQLIDRGVDSELLATCGLGVHSFLSGSSSCNNITDFHSFEKAVNVSALRQDCKAGGPGDFECRNCVRAMGMAVCSLNQIPIKGKSKCPEFVLTYVGGGINCYDALGPDAAFCILSVDNLSAVATALGPPPRRHNRAAPNAVNKTLIMTLVPSLAVLILVLATVFWYLRRLRSGKESQQRKLIRRYEILSESTGLIFFNMPEIKEATENFSESNLIGEGGFGKVYRGTLADGRRLAVKRFKDLKQRAEEEFSHEVQVISSAKHRNLLPLKGYSVGIIAQVIEQVLVYDLMENGSLAEYFFSSTKPCLTWPQRFKIFVGIARGLAYLHEDAKPAILHRDVKAANVLLDEELSPLVADFGMAKFKTAGKTHYTTRTVGTMGYVAPEYALYGYLNDKSDVFSFGIVVLELLTGRRAFDSSTNRLEHILVSDWVVDMSQNGKSSEIIDERIRDSGCKQDMEKVLLLALQCAHPRVGCRPSIGEVLLILEGMESPSPNMICALQSMEVDLESSLNNRGDFTWLMSSDTADGLFLSNSSSSSGSRDFSV
ncbi:hypothetical protein SUGI_0262960 [Cryptomeria japonica]|uniref:probable LRR receptor-like serine/threonine-protein kinase RKF3 n=1 Tax=Cryptomeria japonica TaxID=3369 RepID=UPI002408E80F|nr:probable LRR receptor-like serine/threonine-protein kinase RKF3 [Cryptomeria japonica]GLJ15914.1 hypothetical protein SUGI_0262960 [Cryptomeria japonica]